MDNISDISNAYSYRFSGYQLHMIELDETGPQYVQMEPHPYFSNTKPMDWRKPTYISDLGKRGDAHIYDGTTYATPEPVFDPL